jgi:hypothetical protein
MHPKNAVTASSSATTYAMRTLNRSILVAVFGRAIVDFLSPHRLVDLSGSAPGHILIGKPSTPQTT